MHGPGTPGGSAATVVAVEGGKVTVTNPTRDLMTRFGELGGTGPLSYGRGRPRATVTLWANRVREARAAS